MTETIQILFSKVDNVEIFADVLIPSGATKNEPAPVIIWWHGGGLLQGTRKGLPPHLKRAPKKHGVAVISADYRLAPQVRLPSILADLAALLEYIHTPEFKSATGDRIDTSRIVLSGSSAGGWLALLAGFGIGYAECNLTAPNITGVKGIAAIYPISDLHHPFWNTKQHPVSYMPRVIDGPKELGEALDPKAPVSSFSELTSSRSVFYHYMVQEALLPSLLLDGTNLSPSMFSIAPALKTGRYSSLPIYLVHGSIDDKVPPQQAIDVYNAAKSQGMDVTLDIEQDKDHLFDQKENEDMESYYNFVKRVFA